MEERKLWIASSLLRNDFLDKHVQLVAHGTNLVKISAICHNCSGSETFLEKGSSINHFGYSNSKRKC